MKHKTLFAVIIAAGLLAAACSGGQAAATPTPEATAEATTAPAPEATGEAQGASTLENIAWTCPEDFSGQELNLYNWAEYIGATTISDFMALCEGVTVTIDYFDTNETLITKIRAGNPGYDIAFPNDYAILILSQEGYLEKVDLANIPNAKNTAERWKGMWFDPNNEWGVPYMWSTFGILYDKEKVTTPPVSWNDFFTYDGPVQWIDDYRGMFGAAYWLAGVPASQTNPEEIRKAAEFLKANGSNAVNMTGGFTDSLENGEVDMILTYSAYYPYLNDACACDRYGYVVPAEGSAVDVTDAVILKGVGNKRLAEAFIDYLNDPYVAAQLTNTTGYNTTNQAAIDSGFIREDLLNNPQLFLAEDEMERLEFYRPITEVEDLYQQLWDEIRITLGIGS